MTAEPTSEPQDDISKFIELTRQRQSVAEGQKSMLDPHREKILAAVAAKLHVTAIREVLESHYGVAVSYSNLRAWIKSRKTSARKSP